MHVLCSLPQQAARCKPWRNSAGVSSARNAANVGRPVMAAPHRLPRRLCVPNATESTGATPSKDEDSDDEMGVLLPEEDWEVPGTYEDAMKAGTKLGKAVAAACDELHTLGELENQVLSQAQELLQRVGYKGSLFQAPSQQPAADAAAETGTGQ